MRILKITLSILTLTLVVFSCTNDDSISASSNADYSKTIVQDKVSVEINSIENTSKVYALEFKIKNTTNKKALTPIVHRLSSYDKSIGDISKDLESFSGVYTIEINGKVLRKTIVENGVIKEVQTYKKTTEEGMKIILDPDIDRSIFDCMEEKLDAMNWIEFIACGITAPECLAVLYASCAWEVWLEHLF